MFDFHTHTFFSDGVLSPIELIRRAYIAGYQAVGITDHVSMSNVDAVITAVVRDCVDAEKHWGIRAIPGVEITHVPAASIAECVKYVRDHGVQLVIVHGETIVEPVEPGTNRAAILTGGVDILAHPGLLTLEDARLAAQNEVYLEISARHGHSLTNGHVVRTAMEAGAKLLVNSDGHEPHDLLSADFPQKIALGAGIPAELVTTVLHHNPQKLLARICEAGAK